MDLPLARRSADGTDEADAGSPPAPRRKVGRPSLTNEQLLDKALDLFLEQGFERTTIDAISAAAGMAKRTVYQRYGDKETLFRAALERAIKDWIVPVERLRELETDDVEETLLKVGSLLVANVMSPAGLRLMRITNAESTRMPEIGVFTFHQGTAPTIEYLCDFFRRRLGEGIGGAEALEDAAVGFLNLVVAGPPTMAAWGLEIEPEVVERRTAFAVRLFLNGLLPSGRSAPDQAAERENRRLRDMLVSALLEADTLKQERAKT